MLSYLPTSVTRIRCLKIKLQHKPLSVCLSVVHRFVPRCILDMHAISDSVCKTTSRVPPSTASRRRSPLIIISQQREPLLAFFYAPCIRKALLLLVRSDDITMTHALNIFAKHSPRRIHRWGSRKMRKTTRSVSLRVYPFFFFFSESFPLFYLLATSLFFQLLVARMYMHATRVASRRFYFPARARNRALN